MMKYLLAFLLTFPALADTIECPPEIRSEQKILDVPKGWKTEEERVNARQTLQYVNLTEGPVDEGVLVQPSEISETKNVWTLDKEKTYHVTCAYEKSYMLLVKELKKVRECEVAKDKGKFSKSIFCK